MAIDRATDVENFRQDFRKTLPADYNGVRHGLTALGIGLVAIAVLVGLVRSPLSWLEWCVVPATMIGWNFVEWGVHAHILHRPRKHPILLALYQRHTHTHHRFFTHDHAAYHDANDLKIVFFPVFALPVVLLLASPVALVAWMSISANAALVMMATVAAMYILFEVMHLCSHVPDNAFVRYCPLINTMRRHHIAHHNQRQMMTTNMTFTFPFADWLMGTSDLDRGLFGMTFNGYATTKLKQPPERHHRGINASANVTGNDA